MSRPVIVVHGGAGTWSSERSARGLEGVTEAAREGSRVLVKRGAAVDAVETAVMAMEDNEVFNAGKGSSLTIDGKIEMEASIMDGKTLKAGAAGLFRDVRNPVRLARIVMDETDYVFVVGEGAETLAEVFEMERANPLTEFKLKDWRERRENLLTGSITYLPKLKRLAKEHPKLFLCDTVGAVALDMDGNVAAATSTSGITLKIPGRIGDSPLIGCGTYADNEAGACSVTGMGEIAIRLVLAKSACEHMRSGSSAQEAAESAIRLVNRRIAGAMNHMGLAAVDLDGNIGVAHNSPHMCWAFMKPSMTLPRASLTGKVVEGF